MVIKESRKFKEQEEFEKAVDYVMEKRYFVDTRVEKNPDSPCFVEIKYPSGRVVRDQCTNLGDAQILIWSDECPAWESWDDLPTSIKVVPSKEDLT